MIANCVCAPKEKAEGIRQELFAAGALSKGFRVRRDGAEVCFPVEMLKIPKKYSKIVCRKEFETITVQRAMTLKDALLFAGKISSLQADEIVNSFDIVGDIAIVEIPDGLEKAENEIAKAVMRQNPSVRVVAKKESPMEGVFRVRRLKIIGGEKRTETTYRESCCSFLLDVSKVYFSVRLAHERLRIESQVRKGEKILALFAGVGPFAIVIARRHPDCKIVGIELNPVAVKYFHKNVEINKAKNVEVVFGDVNTVVPKKYRCWADRIMMPLPHTAGDFLDAALTGANPKGCKVHFYGFVETRRKETKEKVKDIFAPIANLIKTKCAKARLKCKITNKRIVRPYAPYVVQVAVDFVVKRK